MTRPPPGVSFAQFFPNAPKFKTEVQGRADRERSKRGVQAVDTAQESAVVTDADTNDLARPCQNISSTSDTTQPHADDNGSSPGDMPSTVGSASSHASSSSSLFSASALPVATATSSGPSMNATPFTSIDSPSSIHALAKSNMSTPSVVERALDHTMPAGQRLQQDGIPSIERPLARDPLLSVKGIKCTYDPLLDRLRKKNVNKNAKPVYKEFGLVCIITDYLRCRGGGGGASLFSSANG